MQDGVKEESARKGKHMVHVQVLIDIELLAHTDYFVGSYNSGLVGLIEILRFALYGKSRFSFADASEHHRDWSAGIRNYIQSHPDLE